MSEELEQTGNEVQETGNEHLENNEPVTIEDTIRNRLRELHSTEGESAQQSTAQSTTQGTGQQTSANTQSPPTQQQPAQNDYPTTWRKGTLEPKWQTLDPEVKAEIVKREDDMRNGIQQYASAANYAQQVYNLFQPYRHLMQAEGIKDDQLVQQMLNSSFRLYAGTPEQKTMEIIRLAQQNGVNLEGVVAAVANIKQGRDAVDPNLVRLQQELGTIQQQQQAFVQAQQDAYVAQANQHVAQFAESIKDNNLLEEPGVRELMAQLVETGQANNIQDAYDKAVWALPETRAKLTAAQQTAEQKKAAEKAAAAKKAASTNVTTVGKHSGKASQKIGKMEDTIRATLRNMKEEGRA